MWSNLSLENHRSGVKNHKTATLSCPLRTLFLSSPVRKICGSCFSQLILFPPFIIDGLLKWVNWLAFKGHLSRCFNACHLFLLAFELQKSAHDASTPPPPMLTWQYYVVFCPPCKEILLILTTGTLIYDMRTTVVMRGICAQFSAISVGFWSCLSCS